MKKYLCMLLITVLFGIDIQLCAAPSTPSQVSVNGRKILLQKRLSNNTLSPAITFTINGVNWAPVPVGSAAVNWTQYYVQDINLISQLNASVVRTYSPLPLDATSLAILDYCYDHNVYMIMNVGYNTSDTAVAQVVNYFKNHPAILMFEVGNEWNYNNGYGTFGNSIATSAATVQRMAGVIKANDGAHPVTSSIGNAYDSTPANNNVFSICSNVDVWGFNTYLNSTATAAVNAAAGYTTKPFYFSEIGTDAFNNITQTEDQADQATYTLQHWNSVSAASQFTVQNGVMSGEVFFEFADEWWKASGSYSAHDSGGAGLDLYDHFGNEEWWGFVDVYRNPRQVYTAMQGVWRGLNAIPTGGPLPTPYGGTAFTIASAVPSTLQVENYDVGGQGVAYSDTDTANNGGTYRSDGVDIEITGDSSGGGYDIGWARAGEWLGYTVNVQQAGRYNISVRVSSTAAGNTFHLESGPVGQIGGAGTVNLGSVTVSNTGGWQTWQTVTLSGVSLSAGTQWLRLVEDTGGVNFNYVTFQVPVSPTPYGGTAVTITSASPTTLQVENYDMGGQGVAYSDTDAANNGGRYRTDGVDIETTADLNGGGYDIGWTRAGEWLGYTVNVQQAGHYNISLRVSSTTAGNTVHLESGPVGQVGGAGTTNLGSVTVPNTGGWQTWQTVTLSGVSLSAGTRWLRLVPDTGGVNLNYITVQFSAP